MNDRDKYVFAVLQLCKEAGHEDTAHMLERESGLYFDMAYFGELLQSGNWSEAEKYLSGFTNPRENKYSIKTYFEIRKIAFLEALESKDRTKALDILVKDMKFIQPDYKSLYADLTKLLIVDNIREHSTLSLYPEDLNSIREALVKELEKLIEANPVFDGKLTFPSIDREQLSYLRNRSLKNFNDASPNGSDSNLSLSLATLSLPVTTDSASSSSHLSATVKHPVPQSHIFGTASAGHGNLVALSNARAASNAAVATTNDPTRRYSAVPSIYKDVPRNVITTLDMGSCPTSMDFHPSKSSLLLVGTSVGDISLWDLYDRKLLHHCQFTVWDIKSCSKASQIALENDAKARKQVMLNPSNALLGVLYPRISVKRIAWSPNGCFFGVAYSKHIVQLYSYLGGKTIKRKLELDAHTGCVNDLAFSCPSGQLLVITCGDDKKIQVWNVITGDKQFTFEGHDASVYSLCPHTKQGINFFFSLSVDGNIKAWFYDGTEAKLDFTAPCIGCSRLAYSADGLRLFSCGTKSDNGESVLVEWNDSEGSIARYYQGLSPRRYSVLQFGMINNLLAVGDDHVIKFWDMDDKTLLGAVDAGELPVTPQICCSKTGMLLAVNAVENKIKILANDQGQHSLSPLRNAKEYCAENSKSDEQKDEEEVRSEIVREANTEEESNLREANP